MARKHSPERQEMDKERLEQEPTLDQMFDLNDPKTLKWLGKVAREERLKREAGENDADD